MTDQEDTPTRPVATVSDRRRVVRTLADIGPSEKEIAAALDALKRYGEDLGPFRKNAVRAMLVAAAIQREREAGDKEVSARVEKHLTEAR